MYQRIDNKKRGLITLYLFSWYRQTPYVQIQVKAHAMSAGINFVLLERFFNLAISENKNVHKLTLFILCLYFDNLYHRISFLINATKVVKLF